MRAIICLALLSLGAPAYAAKTDTKTKMAYCQVNKDGHFYGLLPHPEGGDGKITFQFSVSKADDLPYAEGYYGWGKFEIPDSQLEVRAIGYVRFPKSESANYIRFSLIDKAKGISIESGPAQSTRFAFPMGAPLDHMEQNTAWLEINAYPTKNGEAVKQFLSVACWMK